MKLQMAKNSLFAILLRSPWWVSFLVALGFAAVARLVLPDEYFVVGALGGAPFVVIGCMAAWRQFRAPSATRVAKTLEAAAAMGWPQFAAALEAGFRRGGHEVERINNGVGADFVLRKGGRTTLVAGRRWKAGRVGIEPLRELQAACERREVPDAIYVALGDLTENASDFAAGHGIRVMQGADLALLLDLGRPVSAKA